MLSLLGTIIVGLIVGAIARFLLPGEQKMGWILTCLLGIGGAFIARFIGQAMNWYQPRAWPAKPATTEPAMPSRQVRIQPIF